MSRHQKSPKVAVVVPVGPGIQTALDTLDSVEAFCEGSHVVYVVDDCTTDGTYEAILDARKPHWHVLRNKCNQGIDRLTHTLCTGFKAVLHETDCDLVLRLDQDALLIKPGLIADALHFMESHRDVGLFGVYRVDFNRPRSFESHRQLIKTELSWPRRLAGMVPSWAPYFDAAMARNYRPGDNVFGGAYFVTRSCLLSMQAIGALDVPWDWHSRMQEDVYFSMVAVAAGFKLGHFAAPDGPLCMEWRGLPLPALELVASKYKLVHSVDKGKNTTPAENGGKSAREVFKLNRPFRSVPS
ncbi:glycosyltransferase family 2 protein [Azohydromonas lata]|uniref:Glycosyltransferase n=1 Tax=Azohydromonas lata TaxID=45677 RepID=A0ABU5IAL9_9BURK|nr:glycosyltransferase [Azohydromonas lata]MDZ5455977.1 glycosyltransferase [Azohydromonas lata]